ncbi:MAG: hypothetical protein KDJ52_32030 [Anaerolineae bacterium]|nr:hypothetical protein [Anaerolineae bacterium]
MRLGKKIIIGGAIVIILIALYVIWATIVDYWLVAQLPAPWKSYAKWMAGATLIAVALLAGIANITGYSLKDFLSKASSSQASPITPTQRGKITGEHAAMSNPANGSTGPDYVTQFPQLTLKLFLESGAYQDKITFTQPQRDGVVQDYYFLFGLSLQNVVEKSIPARDIDIRVEIFWNGVDLQSAPEFITDGPGWQASRSRIQQAGDLPLPAVLEFKGTEHDRCTFGHPLEWTKFRGHLSRKANGYFLLYYRISSGSPHTTSTNELRIVLQ